MADNFSLAWRQVQHERAESAVVLDEHFQRAGQAAGELEEGGLVSKVAAADAIDAVAHLQARRRRGRTGHNLADDYRVARRRRSARQSLAATGDRRAAGQSARRLPGGGAVFVLGLGRHAKRGGAGASAIAYRIANANRPTRSMPSRLIFAATSVGLW